MIAVRPDRLASHHTRDCAVLRVCMGVGIGVRYKYRGSGSCNISSSITISDSDSGTFPQ